MSAQSLQTLAESYPPGDPAELMALVQRYERRREQEILDIAAVAADVFADSILNLGLEPESNPLLMRAFSLQYPNEDPSSLAGASPEQLAGWVNGVKGKFFEVLVEKRLNDGERLGELALGPGQVARLAESPTQPGLDLEIVNPDGSIAEEIQLKATNYMSYIKQTLEEYPDIRIATTSEIDGAAENILQTNISDQELEEITQGQLGELAEDTFTDTWNQAAELAFYAVPILPAVLIMVTEGRAVFVGRSSMKEALQRGTKRLKRSAVFTSLGATLGALGAGPASVPITVGARVAWGRMMNRIGMGEFIQSQTEALRQLTTT